ncbi:MAG: alkane 1-monooxygenase [Sphingomonadales bacterium]
MKRLKYLLVFTLPLTVGISFGTEGWLSYLPVYIFFVVVPFLELVFPSHWQRNEATEIELNSASKYYDYLLYSLVFIQWAFLFFYLQNQSFAPDQMTWWGRAISMGIMCGVIGINVGHELGHRLGRFEQFMGELLLLSSLENHFLPYHNRGHHNNVATPNDPATARKNEAVYIFWFRSQIGSYFQAWQIESKRMQIMGTSFFSLRNKMLVYTLVHINLFALILFFFEVQTLLSFITVAAIGILLLETVNYIEHYGLLRQKNENGRYELVKRKHSWNSNHILGRLILFELSRHSEHHYKPDKPYQLLNSDASAPTMPTGYPGMMLLSFVPPIFFRVMNKRVVAVLNNSPQ